MGARTEQVERVRVGAVGKQSGDQGEVAALHGGAERRLARLEQLVGVGALLEQQRRQLVPPKSEHRFLTWLWTGYDFGEGYKGPDNRTR